MVESARFNCSCASSWLLLYWVNCDTVLVREAMLAAPIGLSEGVLICLPLDSCSSVAISWLWLLLIACSPFWNIVYVETLNMASGADRQDLVKQRGGDRDDLGRRLVLLLVLQQLRGLFVQVDAGQRALGIDRVLQDRLLILLLGLRVGRHRSDLRHHRGIAGAKRRAIDQIGVLQLRQRQGVRVVTGAADIGSDVDLVTALRSSEQGQAPAVELDRLAGRVR